MSRNDEIKAILDATGFKVHVNLQRLLYLLIVAGIVVFIVGLVGNQPHLAWQALLVNTMFFSGLALGGLMLSVIFTITSAVWGRPIKRLAEAMTVFLPVGVVLFIILFFGAEQIFQWTDPQKVIHAKAGWLNFPFFVIRNSFLLGLMAILTWFYIKSTLRPDIGLAKKLGDLKSVLTEKLTINYLSQQSEEIRFQRRTKVMAPPLALVFAVLCTLLAFDWMMSIDQEWFSTMFGVQYAVSNLLGAAAALLIISGIARRRFKLEEYITIARYHDLAKLTFAACALWTYMIFSQVLVIWYANLPEETPYLILRMQSLEWSWMFWLIMALLFIIPFFGLMSRTACNSIWFSRIIAMEILIGIWLEKYFLIVPSVQENNAISSLKSGQEGLVGFVFNFYDMFITLAVLSVFVLSYLWLLQRVPVVPISDELLCKADFESSE